MSKSILYCAATVKEMNARLNAFNLKFENLSNFSELVWAKSWTQGNTEYIFAVTGVGIPLTIARLLPLAAGCRPRKIINVGIAGAYVGSNLKVGDLVSGVSECFGDLGMELPSEKVQDIGDPEDNEEKFLPLSATSWADEIYQTPFLLVQEPNLPAGIGCTVNACTGRAATGELRRKLFGADFETMEGAAVALVGKFVGIKVCEIRAISNLASTRDMRPENVELALKNLTQYFGQSSPE